jgi:hypothetical protein
MDTAPKPIANLYINKFIEWLWTKRQNKSGQTTEEATGWMRLKQASNDLVPWKRDDTF